MLSLLFAALLAPAHAGPWVKAPGEFYLKSGYVLFTADEFVDPSGATLAGTSYAGQTAHVYGEVGVVGPIQAVFNLPFVASRNTAAGASYINRGLGDAEVGLAAGTQVADKVPVSVQVLAKVPLYDNADLLQYGLAGTRFPAIGDGQLDITTMFAVGSGVSLGGFRGWVAAEAGYRHRTEVWLGDSSESNRELVDSVPWHAQIGWSPTFGEWKAGWLSVDAWAVQNIQDSDNTKEWIQLATSLGVSVFHGLAVEAGYSRMVWGRSTSIGQSVLAGVSYTL